VPDGQYSDLEHFRDYLGHPGFRYLTYEQIVFLSPLSVGAN